MSLLDVLDKFSEGQNRSSGGLGGLNYDDQPYWATPAPTLGQPGGGQGGSTAAGSSRERGAPERFDINNFVKSGLSSDNALQVLEIAGRAPGFALERPVAAAQTGVKAATGIDIAGAVGSVPILGQVLGTAGDIFANISGLPAALANASIAESLKRGVNEGWSDDQLVPYVDNWDMAMKGNILTAPLSELMGGKPYEDITWGEFKARARDRGFTEDDVMSLTSGTKAPWDFGDHKMVEDGLGDVALRLLSDPTNLLLGAGFALKIPSGLGLLGRAARLGAELEKPLAISEAAAAVAKADSLGATWLGMAEHMGQIGRLSGTYLPGSAMALRGAGKGVSIAGTAARAYKKTALALTAGQLAISGADELMGGRNRPHSGFLEPLFEANRTIFDNQPLSQNQSFSLLSAFMIGPHEVLGPSFRAAKTTIRKFDQAGTRGAVLDALSEGMTGSRSARHTRAIELVGGEQELDNLVYHLHARIVFDKVFANPALKAALEKADSLDEAALANAKVKDIVDAEIIAGLKEGRISKRQVVDTMRDWHANRSGVAHSVEFPWDGELAAARWNEYATAAGPISRVFQERAAAVIGLADELTTVDLEVARTTLRVAAADGSVPIADVRRVLSRYPQLLTLDKGAWEKFLLRDADRTSVPLKDIERAIKRAQKNAPTLRDLTAEQAAAERAAAHGGRPEPEPIAPESARLNQLAVAGQAMETGSTFVNVSRMRPAIARRLKVDWSTLDGVRTARGESRIAAFEEEAGGILADQGFPVDSVTQAAGIWDGSLEPSIEIAMSRGTLEEARLVAATLGKVGEQDSVAVAVTGERIAELGLKPNGIEVSWMLPTDDPAVIQSAIAALGREFPAGTVNDTLGTLRVLIDESEAGAAAAKIQNVTRELEGILPADAMGERGLRHSIQKAYIEFPGKQGDLTYDGIIRTARADKDPRARAYLGARKLLADRRRAEGVAGGRDSALGAVGREPGDRGLDASDLAQPPAERVGLGTSDTIVPEAGFLYRALKPEALEAVSRDGLRTTPPVAGGSWGDGGVGARQYFLRSDALAAAGDRAIVRLREADARVAVDASAGQPFVRRRIRADELEVWGADGAWHPLETWHTPPIEPEIAAAAATVADAYPRVTSATFGRQMADAFGGNDEQALTYAALGEAMANSWASRTGLPAEEWYSTVFAGIQAGGEPGGLHQIAARQARVETVAAAGGDVRALIEEPVPDVLAQHGLGGESPLEWVEYEGRDIAIPGGVEGLADGEFTLWDLWRLKAQQINPSILPESVRVPLYQKLFRSQMRALDNPVDAFNRVAFATLSPLTNLTQNEALLTFVRARDMDGIGRLAEIADRVEAAAEAQGLKGPKVTSEVGYAVQRELGILDFPVGIKTITTNGALASVARVARIFRDNPDFFRLRAGEDLVQYSERLMNVLPGSGMKVGNFSAMLGNPFTFDRGTIDSHIVELLEREGRLSAELANRLKGNAPSAKAIVYRKPDGTINPAVPEHLRDLPIEPADNKVRVYDGDYRELNEVLRQKQADEGLSGDFGLGGYQWYAWDLKRGKFEPHSVIYPGSHELPPIEQQALAQALGEHKKLGYLESKEARAGGVSPTRALYYQTADAPRVPGDVPEERVQAPEPKDDLFGGERTTYEDELAAFRGEPLMQDAGSIVKGSAELLDSGQAVLRGITSPDFSTGVHELWHAAQRHVDPADLSIMEGHYGVRDGVWLRDHHESAARDFERYLRDGKAPTTALAPLFAKMRQFLTAVYARLKGSPIEKGIHPDIRAVFDRALTELPVELRPAARPSPLGVGMRAAEDRGRAGLAMDEVGLRAELAGLAGETGPRTAPTAEFDAVAPERGVVEARTIADGYMAAKGMDVPERRNFKVDEDFGLRTAHAYDALPEPTSPVKPTLDHTVTTAELESAGRDLRTDHPVGDDVRAAYQAFVDETLEQYQAIRAAGIEIVPITADPYGSSAEMMADVAENRRLKVFASAVEHPLLTDEQTVIFRGVHDFFAHAAEGNQFGPRGELNAAVKHSQMYSPLARKAMLTETHGQNSVVNFSDRVVTADGMTVAAVNKAKPGSIYATQKAALLPDDILREFEARHHGVDVAGRIDEVRTRLDQSALAKDELRRQGILYMASTDARVSRSIPLHRSLDGRPAEVRAELDQLQADLSAHYGPYVLKAPPKLAQFYDQHQGDLITEHLRNHGALGEVLATWGPFGRVNRLIEWLTAPVENSRLGQAALQSLYNELLPKGATVAEVQRFVKALNQEANVHSIGPLEVRTFRNGTSLTQQAINKIAAGDATAGLPAIFNDKAIAAVGRDGFARHMDRASNRFYRWADGIAPEGGARGSLARGFTKTYEAYQPTAAGSAQRYVSKTMYHWFRFLSDPRWWAMNIFEADMIGGLRYGVSATRAMSANKAPVSAPSLIHQFGGSTDRAAKDLADTLGGADTGWLYTRRLGGYVSRAFDHERPEQTLDVLRGLAKDDPILAELQRRFGGSPDDIVEGIDKMLYSWDTKGPQTTLIEEAQAVLGQDEADRLMPFLNKVWQKHEQTYRDISRIFHGNPDRTTLERLGNSYWLYWPLSYQIKATKWLVDMMTHRAFGRNTKLAPAAFYASHYEDHKRRMAEDEGYAQVFEKHPTLWFMAQMLFPITPGDMGVSLSRPVRFAGGKLGLWGDYKSASDPVTAAGAILSLGPTYSAELMTRVGRELFSKPTQNLYPAQPLGPLQGQGVYAP